MNTALIGTRKGLLVYDIEKNCVRHEHFAGVPISYAMQDPRTGTVWACLDHGHWAQKLHRSDDNGATFSEVTAPAYPAGARLKEDTPATISYMWIIEPGGDDQPERLYIGAEPSGLFQSDDSGQTWQLVESLWNHPARGKWWFGGGRDLPGVCSIQVDPRDSQHLTVGISVGGVYESRDGGQSWEGRNKGLKACYMPDPYVEHGHDPHYMLASPANPDVLWQQNHCGVFRTTDGGQEWVDISQEGGPVFFGFAIAVDEDDPEVAWVVPAIDADQRQAVEHALVVCRTDDGGKTWHEFRQGLPQRDCYDLVFRHALGKQGDRLAFGSTTGNLFISDDRGESWRTLSQHLPPVYSVRFMGDPA
jgi:hypothetical protein